MIGTSVMKELTKFVSVVCGYREAKLSSSPPSLSSDVYLEPSRTSAVELFCENS